MPRPKPGALPLGDAPSRYLNRIIAVNRLNVSSRIIEGTGGGVLDMGIDKGKLPVQIGNDQ